MRFLLIRFLACLQMIWLPVVLEACCCGSDAVATRTPSTQPRMLQPYPPQPGYGTPPVTHPQPTYRHFEGPITGIVVESLECLEQAGSKYTRENVVKIFDQYQTPEGMLPRLLELCHYCLNFIIDDSGSMNCSSEWLDASSIQRSSSRWQEVQYRLEIFFHHLACVPVKHMQISFLNRPDTIIFNPEQFQNVRDFIAFAKQQLILVFNHHPNGFTPTYNKLQSAFQLTGRWYHYFFTDGAPTDAYNHETEEEQQRVINLVKKRLNPENHLLTVLTCSDGRPRWLMKLDKTAAFVSVIDDYAAEKQEVEEAQGKKFPFSFGLWVACNLLSAKDKVLDDLDEKKVQPFAESEYQSITGRINSDEYKAYTAVRPQHQVPVVPNPL
jgi:hypothetical protein